MSYDLNLRTVCNHRIYRDLGILDADRQIIRVSKPLSSTVNIELFASDNLVPRSMYIVIGDPDAITVTQPQVLYLNEKWRSPSDFFEVSYNTISNFCPKCVGLNILDDISYNVRGALRVARDEHLLLQNLEKFTVTEIGSNPFHTFIGTALVSLLGAKFSDRSFIATRTTQEINNTLQKLMDLQNQYQFAGRAMTNGETLDSINNIEVVPDEDDPTILRATVSVTAKSGKTFDYEQYLKLAEG